MRNIVKNPGKLKHVAPAIAYLKHCGADGIEVRQNGHVQIGWTSDGRPLSISLPSRPKNTDHVVHQARQQIRREYRKAGVEVWA